MKRLLMLAAFCLSVLLYFQWVNAPQVPSLGRLNLEQVEPASPYEPLGRESPDLSLGEREQYEEAAEHTLFREERHPPEGGAQGTNTAVGDAAGATELDQLDLSAVLITPQHKIAWVRNITDNKLVRVKMGKKLQGWSVSDISADRIRIKGQGKEQELILRDYTKFPPLKRKPARKRRNNRLARRGLNEKTAAQEARNGKRTSAIPSKRRDTNGAQKTKATPPIDATPEAAEESGNDRDQGNKEASKR